MVDIWINQGETAPHWNRPAKRSSIPAYAEFQLSFEVRLPDAPENGARGLIEFQPVGLAQPVLEVSLDHGYLHVLWEPLDMYGDICGHVVSLKTKAALVPGRPANIQISVQGGEVQITVDGALNTKAECVKQYNHELHYQTWRVYICGIHVKPSASTLRNVVYKPVGEAKDTGPTKIDMSRQDDFPLPLPDKRLLHSLEAEMLASKRWQKFDSFFGIFLVVNSMMLGFSVEFEESNPDFPWTGVEQGFLVIFTIEIVLRIIMLIGGEIIDYQAEGYDNATMLGILNGMRKTCTDRWIIFDFLVLFISVLNLYGQSVEMPFPLSLLRLLRLLKLAKMVRIIRAFRSLGLLVECLFQAFSTLGWTCLLLIIILYIGGVIMVKLSKWNEDDTGNYETIPTAMWSLLVDLTFDDWTSGVEHIAFELDSPVGALFMLFFVAFAGLGITNLVLGVISLEAFEVGIKMDAIKSAEKLTKKRMTMSRLKRTLKTYGNRPLFQDDRYIWIHEVFDLLDTQEIKESLHILEITLDDFSSCIGTFTDHQGKIEIDGLLEALATIMLQAHFAHSSEVSGNDGKVRPVDLLFFSKGLRFLHNSHVGVQRNCELISSCVHDLLHVCNQIAHNNGAIVQFGNISRKFAEEREKEKQKLVRRNTWMEDRRSRFEARYLDMYIQSMRSKILETKLGMPMDTFFGFFVVINGCYLGMDDMDETAEICIELIFTYIFIWEFFLRVNLFTVVESCKANQGNQHGDSSYGVRSSSKTVNMEKYTFRGIDEESVLRWRIFPRIPEGGFFQQFLDFPLMMKDPWFVLDIVICGFMLVDNVILLFLRLNKITDLSFNSFSVIRTLRLFRLVRLLRIFRLVPLLFLILQSLVMTLSSIFWGTVLLFVSIYSLAIALRRTVSEDERLMSDPAEFDKFGTLSSCMLTLWQFITFDHWRDILVSACKSSTLWGIPLFILLILSGLGVMNLIVGIMCSTAISLVEADEEARHVERMLKFIKAIDMLRKILGDSFGGVMSKGLLIDFFEHSRNLGDLTIEGDETVMQVVNAGMTVSSSPTQQRLSQCSDGTLIERSGTIADIVKTTGSKSDLQMFMAQKYLDVFEALEQTKLNKTFLQTIFTKVDYMKAGKVDRQTFMSACVGVREDCSQVDMYVMKNQLREVLPTMRELSHALGHVFLRMSLVLQQFDAVAHHREYNEDMLLHRALKKEVAMLHFEEHSMASLACVDQVTAKSIEELALSYKDPKQSGKSGNVRVTSGTGQLDLQASVGEIVFGVGTKFKSELAQEDLLVIEKVMYDFTAQTENVRVFTAVVKQVVSNTAIRTLGGILGGKEELRGMTSDFKIAHRCPPGEVEMSELLQEDEDDDTKATLDQATIHQRQALREQNLKPEEPTLCHLPGKTDLWATPRTCQMMFNWDVQTRAHTHQASARTQESAVDLIVEYEEICRDYVDVCAQLLLSEAFLGFKQAYLASRETGDIAQNDSNEHTPITSARSMPTSARGLPNSSGPALSSQESPQNTRQRGTLMETGGSSLPDMPLSPQPVPGMNFPADVRQSVSELNLQSDMQQLPVNMRQSVPELKIPQPVPGLKLPANQMPLSSRQASPASPALRIGLPHEEVAQRQMESQAQSKHVPPDLPPEVSRAKLDLALSGAAAQRPRRRSQQLQPLPEERSIFDCGSVPICTKRDREDWPECDNPELAPDMVTPLSVIAEEHPQHDYELGEKFDAGLMGKRLPERR